MQTAEQFWARCVEDGDHVVWQGARNKDGYGCLKWQGQTLRAHRVAFFLRMGRWPEPIARHLPGCRRRDCVLHVVDGTMAENAQDRSAAGTHWPLNVTACPRGHEYDEANTYIRPDGRRKCRACQRALTVVEQVF